MVCVKILCVINNNACLATSEALSLYIHCVDYILLTLLNTNYFYTFLYCNAFTCKRNIRVLVLCIAIHAVLFSSSVPVGGPSPPYGHISSYIYAFKYSKKKLALRAKIKFTNPAPNKLLSTKYRGKFYFGQSTNVYYFFLTMQAFLHFVLGDLVGLVTPPLFAQSIKGHRGHEEGKLG